MAIWVPWLVDAARLPGYPVVEVAGWRQRGHGGMRVVEGVVVHHTAGAARGDYPSLRIVRDGRAGLKGPLSQLGMARSGTVYVIAAGQSWHAGASRHQTYRDLNDEFLGIEAESVGNGSDWSAEQLDCYPRLVAALLYYMRRASDRAAAHREVALPAGRKPDPRGIDMAQFRSRVAWLLVDPLRRIPRVAGAPPAAGVPPWPLPTGHYFGLITGPDQSHGGYYEHERSWVRLIQQALIRKGYVPGITDPSLGWADGIFEQPTADAVSRFQRAEMPGTTYYGQVWADDWRKLLG